MKYIKSCGFSAYKSKNGKNLYLIIKSLHGDVGFPKGHTELGDTQLESAIRELKEETGVEVRTIQGFKRKIEYILPNTSDTVKQAVYFLGECVSDVIVCQESEVVEAKFVSYEEALSILSFDETKNILFAM